MPSQGPFRHRPKNPQPQNGHPCCMQAR